MVFVFDEKFFEFVYDVVIVVCEEVYGGVFVIGAIGAFDAMGVIFNRVR